MIKVFKINDLIRYLIRILIPVSVLLIIIQTVSKNKVNFQANISINSEPLFNCISQTVPQIKIVKEKNADVASNQSFIFLSELSIMKNIYKEKVDSETENITENQNNNEPQDTPVVVQAETGVETEVVPNNVNPRVTNDYNGVTVNNTSDKELTYEMLIPDIEINKSKVIMYHTHTCESYTPTEQNYYEMSGNYRSIDLNYSVAGVGDELVNQLSSYGIETIHDKTYHDYPAYNGSYSRSLVTAQNALNSNPGTDIIIDLHRDAIADANYAPKVKIGDEYASQLMFVIGANNEGYTQNLKFAIKVMEKANELYPRTI